MKKFLTAIDIEFEAQHGRKRIAVDDDTVITAVARETAEKLGVEFVKYGTETPNAAAQPEKVPQPASSADPMTSANSVDDSAIRRLAMLLESSIRSTARMHPATDPAESSVPDLVIANARIVLPAEGILTGSIEVTGGKISAISTSRPARARRVVDASGLYALPGVIDPHIHLGLFADMAEEMRSESRSAALGGITSAGCFFGGTGSHLNILRNLDDLVEAYSVIDLIPHLVIGTEEQLAEIPRYVHEFGVTSFKLYMCGIPGIIKEVDDGFMLDVFNQIKATGRDCVVCIHAENASIVARAMRRVLAGARPDAGLAEWAATHPSIAEEEAIRRAAFLAGKTGITVYFVHVSSAAGVEALKEVRRSYPPVFAETTSPYLTVTSGSGLGNVAKMEPPFRDSESYRALWQAVASGLIDTIGTDNVTMTLAQKQTGGSIWDAMPGYPAMGTHLPVLLDEGVHRHGLSLTRLAEMTSRNPATIFGLYPRKGTLLPGSDADIVLVDLDRQEYVSHRNLGSRADFSLYEGRRIRGWPVLTIKSGQIVAEDGRLTGNSPKGRVLWNRYWRQSTD